MDPNLQNEQREKVNKNVFWIYVIGVFLAIALGVSGYFIGYEQALSKKPVTAKKTVLPQPKLSSGLLKAQDSIKVNSGFLSFTHIIQAYSGKLIKFVPEKSWTLENKGKTITINNESGDAIKYYIKPDGPKSVSQPAKTQLNLKEGDDVIVQAQHTASKTTLNIDRITLVVSPATSPSSL